MAVRPSLNHKPPAHAADKPAAPGPAPKDRLDPPPDSEAGRRPRAMVRGYRPPSRQGKRAAVAWLEPEAIDQLNIEAIRRHRHVQDILREAVNDWFAKEGLPRFDPEG